MLDKDLAGLYGVQTKMLNQAVKRNLERFPEDFMLPMTKKSPKIGDAGLAHPIKMDRIL